MSEVTLRQVIRDWLAVNYTDAVRNSTEGSEIRKAWYTKLADKGWIAPHWPKQYGGADFNFQEHIALQQEFTSAGVIALPGYSGQGLNMIGPTLLEYGTDDQKARHLPGIARGEVQWCQGYSEPGSGSDLASLSTSAVLDGDHYVLNGQKIWTSDAHEADWIYVLVRTDPKAKKHDGISMVLVDINQPGVTIKPILLISGSSPFCETFFDDAIASDLIGKPNHGWTIGKRLLQHERSGIAGMGASGAAAAPTGKPHYHLAELAKQYVGAAGGRISDAVLRDEIIQHRFNQRSLQTTLARTRAENVTGVTLGFATSIFKAVGANQSKAETELQVRIMGAQGTGWEGESFSPQEIGATRNWLSRRAISIAGGTNEVQLNIIAKRVLGLPD
ncbi:MAG: acyl-CoA dehydrogenase family protein [Pseudomonadales bacterium]|nr:acyl-CoA dehydrogenase family protein [Pseudomonadales bacterium]